MEQGIALQREDRQLNDPSKLNTSNSFHMWLLNAALNNLGDLDHGL